MTYRAVDSFDVPSPFEAQVVLTVKLPGPRIIGIRAVLRGLGASLAARGMLLAVDFDRATNRRTDWRGFFRVVNGTFGMADVVGTWDKNGTSLLLEIGGDVGEYYSLVTSGACADHGLGPILNAMNCEAAARGLNLSSGSASAESLAGRPEGCYLLNGMSLQFNMDSSSRGNGAERSTPGFSRLPLCSAPAYRMDVGLSRLQFVPNFSSPLASATGDSYPVVDLSPVLTGSWTERFCPNGTFFSMQTADCVSCTPGFFQSADGYRCDPCPAGTAAPQGKMMSCEACALGKYLPPLSSERDKCLDAQPGQYVDTVGATRALQCPLGAVTEGIGSTACQRCPQGASCEVVREPLTRMFAVPQAEHFRSTAGAILTCTLPLACLGWDLKANENECAEGMGGFLCQGCEKGYWRPTSRTAALCERCTDESALAGQSRFCVVIILQSIIVWIIAVMSIDAACWGNMHAVFLRLALNYFSVASVLSRLESWEFQRALGVETGSSGIITYVQGIIAAVLRFDGGIAAHLLGLECLFGKDGQWAALKRATVLWAFMPLVWPLALLLVSFVAFECYTWFKRIVWKLRHEPVKAQTLEHARNVTEDIFVREPRLLGLARLRAVRSPCCARWTMVCQDNMPLMVVAQFLILPSVLRQLAVVLACDHLAGGDFRLFVAPEVQCWTGSHAAYAALAVCAVAVWAVAVPVLVSLYLARNRARIFDDVQFRACFCFISDGYERGWIWWECIVYARKILIIAVGAWPDLTRPAELAMYQVVGVFAMLLHYFAKPFDNRSGEILDRLELYGMCCFLVLVTFMQVVLLADPKSEYDLLPVLLACTVLGVSAVFMETHTSMMRFYASMGVAGFFAIVLILYLLSGGLQNRQRSALMLLCFGLVLNVGYVLLLAWKVLKQIGEGLAEYFVRRQLAQDNQFLMGASQDALTIAVHAKHMLAHSVPYGSFFRKPVMPPKPSRSLAAGLQSYIMRAHFDNFPARVWFDVRSRELVLGLHPEHFANEQRISNYMRRKMAASGPFLTDEERRFIAMALRDALLHLIVDCDQNMVHCSLLELLIRSAFVWHTRQECVTELDQHGNFRVTQGPGAKDGFVKQCFEAETFEQSMTAADFSGHIGKFLRMPIGEVEELVEAFLKQHTHCDDAGDDGRAVSEPPSPGNRLG